MIIVFDTTPISELAKVEYLDLWAQIFGNVVISQGVFNKLQIGQHSAVFIIQNLAWLEIITVDNQQAYNSYSYLI